MHKFSTLFWVVIIIAGVTLFIVGNNNSDPQVMDDEEVASISPTPDQASISSSEPTPTQSQEDLISKQGEFGNEDVLDIPNSVPRDQITGPASCELTGRITFLDQNTAENNALIHYSNVDSPARLVFWENSQNDESIDVGPDIFGNLPLPDGSERVLVVFYEPPLAKHYKLTAKVTYAETVDEVGLPLSIGEVDCIGEIEVDISYL